MNLQQGFLTSNMLIHPLFPCEELQGKLLSVEKRIFVYFHYSEDNPSFSSRLFGLATWNDLEVCFFFASLRTSFADVVEISKGPYRGSFKIARTVGQDFCSLRFWVANMTWHERGRLRLNLLKSRFGLTLSLWSFIAWSYSRKDCPIRDDMTGGVRGG